MKSLMIDSGEAYSDSEAERLMASSWSMGHQRKRDFTLVACQKSL